ncbi:hypothetical protein [Methyloglobulus sp.]|uniref:HTH-like domain-containing protein n=1 Tax=Methyloglobulus sp. TaxID=2518622 RepID=UPI003988B244
MQKTMQLLDNIRTALYRAEKEKKKAAILHSLVLIHAIELKNLEPLEFCILLGIHESYKREFLKMLAVSRVLRNSVTLSERTNIMIGQ